MKELLRYIPPVHELQKDEQFEKLVKTLSIPEARVTKTIQTEIDLLRLQLIEGEEPVENPSKQAFFQYILDVTEQKLHIFQQERLFKVINATGTVLHTNLGRARLSDSAIKQMVDVASNYSNLEYNVETGKRGSRHDILEDLLIEITGAEAAMVVNNNAAAVYLVLRALAKDKEVIVSRGQLVEIGGSFRVSSIMEESDAKLVEVGTTNKTHLYDYQQAITETTGMILKVHTSNFKTIGFTESVDTKDLVAIKNKYPHVIFYEDLGSGSLFNFEQLGIGDEPLVKDVIQTGVDLVSFSGDKLLGGPQSGIIVGKKDYIQKLKKHQLARVLRVDKMSYAGLEKTLCSYIYGEEEAKTIPTVRDITKPLEMILKQANQFSRSLHQLTTEYKLDILEESSQIGGGTMPGVELPTYVVGVSHHQLSSQNLARKLRNNKPSIVTRVKDEKVLLDFRTISNEEIPELLEGFRFLGNV
ncbi:L-seryl-tRNA(Sec) selenium transferase [Aquibacillus rhizosphaerae]|uniref:L-seryl-tRNA(Sec) selenium transferase n=1 Tax=Aquibacillus rhizosphaerae TaxID=3051431 RepID=A0ABT7LAH5_9BACI|nr:L-seryl-tRNA(Sec) selenium transferase [Aquibacillus sp. LR5S19]MDL4842257.1 L-seryl-tRNA(Sec) selenium transferase [Aquibacillus sp. LR5S19]